MTTNNPNIADVVQLEPKEEIYFKGPFDVDSFVNLNLTNLSQKLLTFKIKTTVPQMYTVKPTHGTISSLGTSTVSIMLQAADPTSFNKNRHKFLVQVTYGPESEDGQAPADFNAESFWKDVNTKSGQVFEQKLKCAFNLPASKTNAEKSNSSGRRPAMKLSTLPAEKLPEKQVVPFEPSAKANLIRPKLASPSISISTTFSTLTNATHLLESAQSLRDPQNVYVIYGMVLLVLLVALMLGGGSVDDSIRTVQYNRRGGGY